jgi:3' exoribonuclease, RNase T-like
MVTYFYDTEFHEDGRTVDLISIGIVAQDGREYYAVNRDMDVKRIRRNPWLMENVVPHLPHGHGDRRNHIPRRWLFDYDDPQVKPRARIADEVAEFIIGEAELWAYYGAYDHVALAQLWGPMIDLPANVPMFTHELMQLWEESGKPEKPAQVGGHDALVDARWNAALYAACRGDV